MTWSHSQTNITFVLQVLQKEQEIFLEEFSVFVHIFKCRSASIQWQLTESIWSSFYSKYFPKHNLAAWVMSGSSFFKVSNLGWNQELIFNLYLLNTSKHKHETNVKMIPSASKEQYMLKVCISCYQRPVCPSLLATTTTTKKRFQDQS